MTAVPPADLSADSPHAPPRLLDALRDQLHVLCLGGGAVRSPLDNLAAMAAPQPGAAPFTPGAPSAPSARNAPPGPAATGWAASTARLRCATPRRASRPPSAPPARANRVTP